VLRLFYDHGSSASHFTVLVFLGGGGRDGGGADDGGGGVVEAIETLVEGTISIQTSSVSSTSLYVCVCVLDKCTWVCVVYRRYRYR